MPSYSSSFTDLPDGLATLTSSWLVADDVTGIIVLLPLFASGTPAADDPVCTDVSYGGVPLTKIGESAFSAGNHKCLAFALYLPPTGTNDLVTNFTSTGHNGRFWALAYRDLHPQVPWSLVNTITGSSASPTIPYVIGDESDFVLSCAVTGSTNALSVGTPGRTSLAASPSKQPTVTPVMFGAAEKYETATAPTSSNVTWSSGTSNNFAALNLILYDVNRPIAPPGTVPYYLTERNEAYVGGQA